MDVISQGEISPAKVVAGLGRHGRPGMDGPCQSQVGRLDRRRRQCKFCSAIKTMAPMRLVPMQAAITAQMPA